MTIPWLKERLVLAGFSESMAELSALVLFFCALLFATALLTVVIRKVLLRLVTSWIQQNQYRWDDPLASNRLLTKISWIIPLSLISIALDSFLDQSGLTYQVSRKLVLAGFVMVCVLSLNALFSTVNDIHRILRKQKGSTLRGYTDAGKITTFILGAIFLVSIFTGRSPWGILSVLGGLTAVTMLMFKDTLLGFVASVQLTSTDMVRLGDWIEMGQYGADGEVIDMSINCIRVQNWDKTVTTIPTYSLVSSSFKNWRGMSESGGRRIKRALYIDISSIRFCTPEMINRFSGYRLITDYVTSRQKEIDLHNDVHTGEGSPLNGRCQTNIGIFRAYTIAYLKDNPNVHDSMTFLVRQLPPTDLGLPLEVYVFSKDQNWARYEAIQADIFDHLLAAVPEFDLRIYQQPSGNDLLRSTGTIDTPAHDQYAQ